MKKKFTEKQIRSMLPYMEIDVRYNAKAQSFMADEDDDDDYSLGENNGETGYIAVDISVDTSVFFDCEFEDEDLVAIAEVCNGKCLRVANARITIFAPPQEFASTLDWLWACDSSPEICSTLSALCYDDCKFATGEEALHEDMKEMLDSWGVNIYHIDKVCVQKEFRGFGIGKHLVKNLEHILFKADVADCGVFILLASPFELKKKSKEVFEKGSQKLFKFYEDCDFTRISEDVFLKLFE